MSDWWRVCRSGRVIMSERAAAAVRGGAKSELLSLILFMPLTAWKERRRITCQLGCSDPFCDLTSPLTTTVCHRRYFRAKESARQKRENGKIEYKEKWPRAVCKVVGSAVGGVSMKEPRASLFLSFFSVCVGEIIKIRQKSRERERARSRACGGDSSLLCLFNKF